MLRGILFSTYMVPMIAVALVWSKLYSPTEGPLNQVLGWFGIPPQPWLSSPDTALRSLVLLNVWQQVGYFTVLVVAGLTQIPDTLYEAAAIDGASGPRLFWRDHAAADAAHDAVHRRHRPHQRRAGVRAGGAITQGGPVGSTNVLTYHIRRVGIERTQGGLGSAMAVMLLLALVAAVGARVRPPATGRRVDERGAGAAGRRGRGERPARERWSLPNWRRVLAGAVVLVCCVVAAFPLAWMVLTSLKTAHETMQSPPVWFPRHPSLDAYRQVTDGHRRAAGRCATRRSSRPSPPPASSARA